MRNFLLGFIFGLVLVFPTLSTANVLGNFQTFAPNADQFYFETVNSSKILEPGWFNLGLYGNYAKNSLLVYGDFPNQNQKLKYQDSMLSYDFSVAFGIQKNLQVFLQVPGVFNQSSDAGQTPIISLKSGFNTFRPGFKWDISQKKTGGFALVGSLDYPNTKNDPYSGVNPSVIFNVEGVYDIRTERDAFAINVGYRKRNPGATPTDAAMYPLKDQLTSSVGYTKKMSESLWWVTEGFMSYPLIKDPYNNAGDISSIEALGALRYEPETNLIAHLGGTLEVIPGGLAPTYRMVAGLNYYFGLDAKARKARRGFVVTPSRLRMRPEQTYQFSTRGNSGQVKYALLSGGGDIDPETGVYKAPHQPGSARVRVTDEDGNFADATIFIRDVKQVRVAPESTVLLENETEVFSTTGGAPPYVYSLSEDFGKIDSETGDYTAPSKTGEVYLISTDANGRKAQAKIRVKSTPRASMVLTLSDLQFAFNSDQLTANGRDKLDKNLEALRDTQIRSMIVEGHSDNVGADDYNQKLSAKRAETVKGILVDTLGLDPEQIKTIGYGKERPLKPNDTEAGRQANRRVELKIYKDKTLKELEE